MAPRIPRSEYEPKESNLVLANKASPQSFLGKIVMAVNDIVASLIDMNPDKRDNKGRILAEMYLYDELEKYAAAKSKDLWAQAEAQNIYDAKELNEGSHILSESPHFVLTADVSKPVNRFDPTVLANWFNKSKYKIPVIVTKEQIERAKVPGKSTTRLKIVER